MPQPSYFQTIARRAKSHLPLLMPPRSVLPSRRESPLSQVEVPLMPELPVELRPMQSSSPVKGTTISPQQQFPGTPLQDVAVLPPRSPTDGFNTTPLSLSSGVDLPQEIKAAPVIPEMSSVSPVVKSSLQQPSKLAPQPTTSVTQPLQSSVLSATLPDSSATADITQVTSVPKARSYLQTAARTLTPEPGSTVPSPSSAETATLQTTAAETNVPNVSESVVILQPPRNNPVATISSPDTQNFDLLPPSDRRASHFPIATSTGNTVHIGTIDIHITPPPTPPIQPVATAPKPVSLTPLARGFTSGFGLRQG